MRTRCWRWIAVVCCICAICCLTAYMIHSEKASCMAVPIIGEKELSRYTEYEYFDFSPYLSFRGEAAAVDVASSTIYIAQPIVANTKSWDLQGKLEITLPHYSLYFEQSSCLDSLSEAMSTGNTLRLLVTDGTSKYMSYDVVLTSLPVIQINGEIISVNDEGRDVWSGNFCIWTPNDPDSDSYTVKTSNVQWHVRGATSSVFAKKPWKLSVKDSGGNNQNISLLGLGTDDDWILNSMTLDDTKIKEKFTMDLWNEAADISNSSMRMSTGEYVEVIINGEYRGLYLLQRRIDVKYLDLSEEDILLKGKPAWVANTPVEAYEIMYSPFSEDDTYVYAEAFFSGKAFEKVNLDNYVYTNLVILFGSALDNVGYKNMYYVFDIEDNDYTIYYIPWDTDMSYGVTWKDKFAYDYEKSIGSLPYRGEYSAMLEQYPQLNDQLRETWFRLRNSILSDDRLHSYLDMLTEQVVASGAYARERKKWGTYYGESDTLCNLRKYILERASIMDDHFISQ